MSALGVKADIDWGVIGIDIQPSQNEDTPMQRELVGFISLSAIVIGAFIGSLSTGVTFDCGVGCNFSVTDEPYLEVWGALMGVCAVFFPQLDPIKRADQYVSLWRRTVALVVDFHVIVLSAVAVVFVFLRLVLLAIAQTWNWTKLDPLSPIIGPMNIVGLIGGFTLILLYFWLLPQKGRATVGQYIMGFQIVPDADRPKFWLRPLIGYVAIASLPFWIWFDSKGASEGRYWWDRVSGTRPILAAA